MSTRGSLDPASVQAIASTMPSFAVPNRFGRKILQVGASDVSSDLFCEAQPTPPVSVCRLYYILLDLKGPESLSIAITQCGIIVRRASIDKGANVVKPPGHAAVSLGIGHSVWYNKVAIFFSCCICYRCDDRPRPPRGVLPMVR